MPKSLIQWVAIVAISAAAPARGDERPPWIVEGTAGMVAADHPEASAIGAAVLRAGGSAFDAAIATSAALTVTRPESTGIGGGGFMVAYIAAEKRFVALDFREMAPQAATPVRYAKLHAEIGDGPSASIYGGNAVGVPGLVAGWREVHKRFGQCEWKSLLEPAAELAERGFTVDESCRDGIESALKDFKKHPAFDERFAALKRRIAPQGLAREAGTRWKRKDIAATLRFLAERGPGAFYDGPLASAMLKAIEDAGGAMTADDLRRYRVIERTPLRFSAEFGESSPRFDWVTMPPPSSGGACLAQLVQVEMWLRRQDNVQPGVQAAGYGVGDMNWPFFPYWRIESMKHAFANRARFLADPDYSRVDIREMTSSEYAEKLAERISQGDRPATLDGYGIQPPPDDRGTSHFSIVDRAGNVVAWTETINGGYGSFVVVEPHGIIFNNQMDDFTTVEGESNLFGLVQSKANLVGPGKRPLSSMTPTIVMRDGRPVLAIGGSGGPRIISAVFQVSLGALWNVLPAALMTRARVHHQWQPDEVYFDRELDEGDLRFAEGLKKQGYKVSDKRRGAAVQYISIDPKTGRRTGVCDPRKGGRPAVE